MNVIRLLLILLVFCVNFVFAQANSAELLYEVSPLFQNNEARLKLKLSFKGDKSGITKINLPLEFAGQEKLYNGVQNLKVTTFNAKLIDTSKPEIKQIEHLPNEKITIEYELLQDWQGNPLAGSAGATAGSGYRPVIKPDYFHTLGSGIWILPDVTNETKLNISISWKDFPEKWKLANSFEANQIKQSFQTYRSRFLLSVWVGGDFRLTSKFVKGKPVWTAIRGKLKFGDDEFADLVQKIVEIERDFWVDYKHPFYLVTVLPLEEKGSMSSGGTGLTNSFATFISENVQLDDVSSLLAHEYFHNWNTNSFGGMQNPEPLLYWFSEGFTDYYTYRLLFRAGLIKAEKYISRYNEFLTEYYLSPVRNENNQRVLADFFKNYEVSKLPYRRGFLLATKWNQIISQQSNGKKSLDDVMRNIFQDAKKGKIKQISKDYLIAVLSKYTRYDFVADIEKYVEKGETISDFKGIFGDCVEDYEIGIGKYELGFNADSVKSQTVSGVLKDSVAYDAGLRDGQKILGHTIYFGDPTQNVELIIEEKGNMKKIIYLPQTKEKNGVPQFKLKKNGICSN